MLSVGWREVEQVNPFLDERVLTKHNEPNIIVDRRPNGQLMPGVVLNPTGKPKTKPITDALKRILDIKDDKGNTLADTMAREAIKTAQDRDGKNYIGALNIVLDRVEGKVPVNLGIDDETREFLTGNHIAKLMLEAQQEQKRLTETPQNERERV